MTAELLDETGGELAEEAPPAPAALIDAAQPRTGPVLYYRYNNQEFAVREGTPEHKLLLDAGAARLERLSGGEAPAAASRQSGPSRSTVETRSAAKR